MVTRDLPDHIEQLVERLRRKDHPNVSLTEVAAVTEILMRSLDSYFQNIDLTLYKECQDLADYIKEARQQIAAISPDHADEARLPRAGKELDAIVKQTEEATNTIMEAAESIMSADPSDVSGYQSTVNDEIMRIFEACSFQDITGQRISKVVETLQNIEQRVYHLIDVLDISTDDVTNSNDDKTEDERLLNGPALDGEGIDQSDVDALLGGNAAETQPTQDDIDALLNDATDSDTQASDAASTEQQQKEEQKAKTSPSPAAEPVTLDRGHKKAGVSKADDVDDLILKQDEEGRTTQDDIDALFG